MHAGIQSIAAGLYHSMVLNQDGIVWVTGANGSGQLGDGTTTDKTSFVKNVVLKVPTGQWDVMM